MVSIPNRLFKGWCSNEGNQRSHVLHYHIVTSRLINDYDGGSVNDEINSLEEYYNIDGIGLSDPFYTVSATFKMDIPRGPIKIFETDELRVAVYIVEQLTGNKVMENAS